jgi:hypothetical protein
MCGVTVNQVFPANETWHSLLLQALSGIPDVTGAPATSSTPALSTPPLSPGPARAYQCESVSAN